MLSSVNDKQINFLKKLLFYSAMPTDIREDVELILRTELSKMPTSWLQWKKQVEVIPDLQQPANLLFAA